MAEQDDEWAITRRYKSLESLAQTRIRPLDQPDPDQEEMAALEATGWKQPTEADAASPIHHISGRDREVAGSDF